ncbi:MAG: acyl carrier protein [Steroidobacteraceae bacterium]
MTVHNQNHDAEWVYQMIRSSLVELFRLDPARITPEARLADDLEIDSIDAVDLVDRVRRATGRKVAAEDFRSVRTVSDLAQAVERLIRS